MARRFYVITDIEGVAGIDSFAQTRTDDEAEKREAMDQLGRETNACIAGLREVSPDATVDVLDGHGTGGLRESDLEGGNYLRLPDEDPLVANDYDGVLWVGQHAMAGAPNAPLRHTQSSLHVEYYRVNDTFVGEFGGSAIQAGLEGTPAVFLGGDNKAALEAEWFVPDIETATVKWGKGEEAAEHRDRDAACEVVREGAARAARRVDEIPPLDGFAPPFVVEVRYGDAEHADSREAAHAEVDGVSVTRVDEYTVRSESDTYGHLYP